MAIFDKQFIQPNTSRIISYCNDPYLGNKSLLGSLLERTQQCEKRPRLQINTEFYIDHAEPLDALSNLPIDVEWPLGSSLEKPRVCCRILGWDCWG